MGDTPTGTVTFLFTDIAGSTRLWEERPDEMRAALAEHDGLVRAAIEENGGYVFATGGDGFAAAFSRAHDAIDAASNAQAALADHPLIRVRMGIHTGEVQERDGDYFGPAVNRAARIMAVAHGGQVLLSAATRELLPDRSCRDLGEHRLRDLSAAQRLFQLGEGLFPVLRSVDVVPSNLPTVLTDLVGRSDDVVELSRLAHRDRVLTLTGTGGVGKTRLALAVAGAVAAEFFDGVWFVELAPVADAAGIGRAVAAALGVGSMLGVDQAGVVEYLRGRRLLLILDNCEHVLDAAADFAAAVIAAAPELHVIATSREPLGVDGEVVRRVRSLGVPDESADAATVDAADAVRMFVDRATAASGEFVLGPVNRAAVVEICRKLDGIPLAIELAAARVRAMTPEQIAARLDERFRLLSGARRAQERHRTLQAAVSWSYDLLSVEEQVVFRRLSVFPSSFDMAAAESVAGDGINVLDDLLHLVDRSLVQHDPDTGRYRLLETLRQFGAERAVDADEANDLRERYVAHYVRLLAEVGPRYEGERSATAGAALVVEMDNVVAVAELLIREHRWRDLYELCMSARFFLCLNAPALMMRWLQAALEAGACVDAQEQVDALGLISWNSFSVGDLDLGVRQADESLALAARTEMLPSPWAHFAVGSVRGVQGRRDEYLDHLSDAVRCAERRHDRLSRLFMRATWLDAFLQIHGYDGNEAVVDEVLREASEHPAAHITAVVCAAATAISFQRDLVRGLRYVDSVTDLGAGGALLGAWLSTLHATAHAEVDPRAGVGLAVQGARWSDRCGSPFAMNGAVFTLAFLATRIGRFDTAQQLFAHGEAGTEWREHPGFAWLRSETIAALENAGVTTPVLSHELSRQELYTILTDLQASS